MMLARANACVLPRYLVLPPPTAAAPCLVQTFFAPVEMPAPAPAPATDDLHLLRELSGLEQLHGRRHDSRIGRT